MPRKSPGAITMSQTELCSTEMYRTIKDTKDLDTEAGRIVLGLAGSVGMQEIPRTYSRRGPGYLVLSRVVIPASRALVRAERKRTLQVTHAQVR